MNGATLLPTYTFKAWTGKTLALFTDYRIRISVFSLSQKKQLTGIVKDPCSIVTPAMLINVMNKMAASSQPKFVRMPLFWCVCVVLNS